MSKPIDQLFNVHHAALGARAYRNQVLASNIANADTPGYQARDVDFKAMLSAAVGGEAPRALPGGGQPARPVPQFVALQRTSERHMSAGGTQGISPGGPLIYRTVAQASIDNNTVDINVERAQFADNAMRYEASLTFINSKIKGMLAATQN